MMAWSHRVGGSALAGAAAALWGSLCCGGPGFVRVQRWSEHRDPRLSPLLHSTHDLALRGWHWLAPSGPWLWPWLLIGSVLFWVATTAPDVDHDRSRAARWVRIGGPARGIVHSDWVGIGWVLLGVLDPTHLVGWFAAGWWTHLWLDELSRAGRVHLFPLGRWRIVTGPDGSRTVVKQRWRGIYRVGRASEGVVLVLVVVACAAAAALAWL